MFERFTASARETVVAAQHEARALHHGFIGTEHLLLGILAQAGSPTAAVLTGHGITHDTVVAAVRANLGEDALDAEALSALGIDLAAVRSTVEATFGPGALNREPGLRRSGSYDKGGHIPFTARAKKVLELSLRECVALKGDGITEGHILLGLIREGQGLAMKVVADQGVDPEELRREVRATLTG